MTLRTILVYLENESNTERMTAFAGRIAASHDATLIGMHATPLVPVHGGYADVMSGALGLAFIKQQAETTERIRERFLASAASAGVPARWKGFSDFASDDGRAVCEAAHSSDLIVVPQPDIDNSNSFMHGVQKELVCSTGRPVVHLPEFGDHGDVGMRMLIGWSPTREATRAVHDALQLALPGAEATVLWVSHGRRHDPHVERTAEAMAELLVTHGIKATVAKWQNTQLAIGDVLLNESSDRGTDLIVTGAYGHSRFYDMVIGATTTHLLEHMTAPVLFSH